METGTPHKQRAFSETSHDSLTSRSTRTRAACIWSRFHPKSGLSCLFICFECQQISEAKPVNSGWTPSFSVSFVFCQISDTTRCQCDLTAMCMYLQYPSGGHLETHGLPVLCLSQGLYPIQVGGLPLEHSPSGLVGFSSFISVEGSEPCTMIPGRSAAAMMI